MKNPTRVARVRRCLDRLGAEYKFMPGRPPDACLWPGFAVRRKGSTALFHDLFITLWKTNITLNFIDSKVKGIDHRITYERVFAWEREDLWIPHLRRLLTLAGFHPGAI